jgi:hypothetical protein
VEDVMADRKQFVRESKTDAELMRLLDIARTNVVSDDVLHEQRISFAFGNALNREFVTKDTVRHSSEHVRLKA